MSYRHSNNITAIATYPPEIDGALDDGGGVLDSAACTAASIAANRAGETAGGSVDGGTEPGTEAEVTGAMTPDTLSVGRVPGAVDMVVTGRVM